MDTWINLRCLINSIATAWKWNPKCMGLMLYMSLPIFPLHLQCGCGRQCLSEWPDRGEKTQTRFVYRKEIYIVISTLQCCQNQFKNLLTFLVCVFLDVVISFVKKTLAGAAGLLRRHKPLAKSYEDGQYEDAQVCAHPPTTRPEWEE